MAGRMAEGCSSVEEVVKLFSFNKFFSLFFPQEDAEFVQLKQPATILEAANVMEEHIRRRGPSRDGYHKQNCFQGNTPPPQGNSYKPQRPTEMTHNGLEQKDYISQSTPTDKPFNGGYGNKTTHTYTFTPTCFECGKKGHKRPQCPSQVALVVVDGGQEDLYVEGKIGKSKCGAQITMDDSSLVNPLQYVGEHVLIKGYRKVPEKVPLAKVWLEVGEYSMQREVAVMNDAKEPVLLGMDLGILQYLLVLEKEQRKNVLGKEELVLEEVRSRQEKVLMKVEKVLVTRAEQSRIDELQVQEEEADRISAASPIPLGELFEMENDIYSSEPVDEEAQSTPDG